MKKCSPFFLILVLLWINGMPLAGQESTIRTDSIVGYVFNSASDSVPSSIVRIHRLDSIHLHEQLWSGLWNTDSAKWLPFRLTYRESDQEGNELVRTLRQWENDLGWVPSDSVWSDFNAAGNMIFNDSYKWDSDLGTWAGDRRREYFYDGEGKDTLMRYSLWDPGVNDWQYSSLLRKIYNQDSRLLESFSFNWDTDEDDWGLSEWRRNEYILDGSDQVLTRNNHLFNLDDSTWVHAYYVDFSYDEVGNVIMEEIYLLEDGEVTMKMEMEYAFDDAGNKTLHSGLTWIIQTDTLVNGNRIVYAFNSLDQETLEDVLIWDEDLDDWLLKSRSISTYNENDLLAAEHHSNWNYPGNGEFSESRTEYLYTLTGKDSVRIDYFYSMSSESLYLGRKDFYYYGVPHITDHTSLPLSARAEIKLYPVPVGDWLMIEAEVPVGCVEVLDMNGRTILSFNRLEAGLNLSSLESGIYLLRLRDAGGMPLGTKRIIKE